MAPEVIELKGASTASDIWSLGCTSEPSIIYRFLLLELTASAVIELIDGKPPYSDMQAFSAMFRIVEDDRPPLPTRASDELCDFLIQCFAKDPKERPTANELFSHPWLQKNWHPHKVSDAVLRSRAGPRNQQTLTIAHITVGPASARLDPFSEAHQHRDAAS